MFDVKYSYPWGIKKTIKVSNHISLPKQHDCKTLERIPSSISQKNNQRQMKHIHWGHRLSTESSRRYWKIHIF